MPDRSLSVRVRVRHKNSVFHTEDLKSAAIIPVKNHRARTIGPRTVNDDLESFIVKLRIGHVLEGEVRTFQFQKLTEGELQLWENREPEFLGRFQVQPEGTEPGEFHAHPIEFVRISGSRMTILKGTTSNSITITYNNNLFASPNTD